MKSTTKKICELTQSNFLAARAENLKGMSSSVISADLLTKEFKKSPLEAGHSEMPPRLLSLYDDISKRSEKCTECGPNLMEEGARAENRCAMSSPGKPSDLSMNEAEIFPIDEGYKEMLQSVESWVDNIFKSSGKLTKSGLNLMTEVTSPADLLFSNKTVLLPILLMDSKKKSHILMIQPLDDGFELLFARSGMLRPTTNPVASYLFHTQHFLQPNEKKKERRVTGQQILNSFLSGSNIMLYDSVAAIPSSFKFLLYQAAFQFENIDLNQTLAGTTHIMAQFGKCRSVRNLIFSRHCRPTENAIHSKISRMCSSAVFFPSHDIPRPEGPWEDMKDELGLESAAVKLYRSSAPPGVKKNFLGASTFRVILDAYCTPWAKAFAKEDFCTWHTSNSCLPLQETATLATGGGKELENKSTHKKSVVGVKHKTESSEESNSDSSQVSDATTSDEEDSSEGSDSASFVLEHSGSNIPSEIDTDEAEAMTKAVSKKHPGGFMVNGNLSDDNDADTEFLPGAEESTEDESEYADSDSYSDTGNSEVSAFQRKRKMKQRRIIKHSSASVVNTEIKNDEELVTKDGIDWIQCIRAKLLVATCLDDEGTTLEGAEISLKFEKAAAAGRFQKEDWDCVNSLMEYCGRRGKRSKLAIDDVETKEDLFMGLIPHILKIKSASAQVSLEATQIENKLTHVGLQELATLHQFSGL